MGSLIDKRYSTFSLYLLFLLLHKFNFIFIISNLITHLALDLHDFIHVSCCNLFAYFWWRIYVTRSRYFNSIQIWPVLRRYIFFLTGYFNVVVVVGLCVEKREISCDKFPQTLLVSSFNICTLLLSVCVWSWMRKLFSKIKKFF